MAADEDMVSHVLSHVVWWKKKKKNFTSFTLPLLVESCTNALITKINEACDQVFFVKNKKRKEEFISSHCKKKKKHLLEEFYAYKICDGLIHIPNIFWR